MFLFGRTAGAGAGVEVSVWADFSCRRAFSSQVPPWSRRKLRIMTRPSAVRMLSGWNCTPSIVYSLWRTPWITPWEPSGRAIHEVTSRHSGRVTRVPAREW